jgi:hypothetical protein
MYRYRITTPEPGWEGKVGTVTFVNGQAEVEADSNAAALVYFHAQGYGIEALDGAPDYRPPGARSAADDVAELEARLAEARERAAAEAAADTSKTTRAKRGAAKDEETAK